MRDFIISLYANENFPIYLGAIILVLLVAFFIVFFLGKKDQKKIEMTQRLEAINPDAFKNVSAPVAVEAPVSVQGVVPPVQAPVQNLVTEIPQAVAPVMPTEPVQMVNEVPIAPAVVDPQVAPGTAPMQPASVYVEPVSIVETPAQPANAPVYMEPTPVEQPIISEPVVPVTPVTMPEVPVTPITNVVNEPMPVINPVPVVEAPVVNPEIPQTIEPQVAPVTPAAPEVPKFNPDPVIEPYIPEVNLTDFNNLANSISNELAELEKQQSIAKPMIENVAPEVPAMNPNNPTKVMTGVFSSVYAPKKEEAAVSDETMEIELPKLKSEPVLTEEKEDSLKI